MLAAIGVTTIDDLFDEIPASLRNTALSGVPPGLTEMEVTRLMQERAERDGRWLNFIGARRVRAPHPGGRVADRDARRVLFVVYAVSGRGEPGHAATAVRIPVDDDVADRDGRDQREPLRRRVGARRGGVDGGARAQVGQARAGARDRASGVSRGRAHDRPRPEHRTRRSSVLHRMRARDSGGIAEIRGRRITPRWWCRSRIISACSNRSTN